MQIAEAKVDGLKHEFKIVIAQADIESQTNKRLMELGKNVKIPGFRPGHIPLPILKQRYQAGIKSEVLEKVIEENTQKLILEKKLRIAIRPDIKIEDYKDGKDLTLKVGLEVLPDIDAVKLEDIKGERLVAEPEEKQVEDALKTLSERNKSLKKVEKKRPSKKGDVLTLDFEGKIEGKSFEGGAAKGAKLELGSNRYIPGFEDQLLGKQADEQVDVVVTFPKDYGNKELAGKKAAFDVKILALEEYSLPEISDSFATEKGFKDFEELKKIVKDQLGDELKRMSFLVAKRKILDELDNAYKIPLPEGLVKAEFDIIWKQYQQEQEKENKAKQKPQDSDNSKKKTAKKTAVEDKSAEAEYRKIAERRVKLGLLLSEIGQAHKVQVTQRELEKALMDTARNYPGQEKKVIDYYRNNANALATLRAPIFEDKVVGLILEKGKIKEKKVSVKELEAAVKQIVEDEEE